MLLAFLLHFVENCRQGEDTGIKLTNSYAKGPAGTPKPEQNEKQLALASASTT